MGILVILIAYGVALELWTRFCPALRRLQGLALVNAVGFAAIFLTAGFSGSLAVYLVVLLVELQLIRAGADRPWLFRLSVALPLAALVTVNFLAARVFGWQIATELRATSEVGIDAFAVGISYMCFRTILLAIQARAEGQVPGLAAGLAYCLHPPTLALGPISRFAVFRDSVLAGRTTKTWDSDAWLRIALGLTKFMILAPVASQLTYTGLVFDGNTHGAVDIGVSIVAYYAFLYFNFSGVCDVGIALSALWGIATEENFDNPILARNLQDFWQRWHITLSSFLRQTLFTPLAQVLARRLGPRARYAPSACALFVTFFCIGVWHGVESHWVVYGVVQGGGMVVWFSWNQLTKKLLSKGQYAAYLRSRSIRIASTAVTYAFVCLSLVLFANSMADVPKVFHLNF